MQGRMDRRERMESFHHVHARPSMSMPKHMPMSMPPGIPRRERRTRDQETPEEEEEEADSSPFPDVDWPPEDDLSSAPSPRGRHQDSDDFSEHTRPYPRRTRAPSVEETSTTARSSSSFIDVGRSIRPRVSHSTGMHHRDDTLPPEARLRRPSVLYDEDAEEIFLLRSTMDNRSRPVSRAYDSRSRSRTRYDAPRNRSPSTNRQRSMPDSKWSPRSSTDRETQLTDHSGGEKLVRYGHGIPHAPPAPPSVHERPSRRLPGPDVGDPRSSGYAPSGRARSPSRVRAQSTSRAQSRPREQSRPASPSRRRSPSRHGSPSRAQSRSRPSSPLRGASRAPSRAPSRAASVKDLRHALVRRAPERQVLDDEESDTEDVYNVPVNDISGDSRSRARSQRYESDGFFPEPAFTRNQYHSREAYPNPGLRRANAYDDVPRGPSKSYARESFGKAGSCKLCGGQSGQPAHKLPGCEHRWCSTCLREDFSLSIDDPLRKPPMCCKHYISPQLVDNLFDPMFKRDWDRKLVHSSIFVSARPHSLVCPNPKCGAPIEDQDIQPDQGGREFGECYHCCTEVCVDCSGRWHKSLQCPPNAMPHCGRCRKTLLPGEPGFNYTICQCNTPCCTVCGLRWKTCDCPFFNVEGSEPLDTLLTGDPRSNPFTHGMQLETDPPSPRKYRSSGGHPRPVVAVHSRPQSYEERLVTDRLREKRSDDPLSRRFYVPGAFEEFEDREVDEDYRRERDDRDRPLKPVNYVRRPEAAVPPPLVHRHTAPPPARSAFERPTPNDWPGAIVPHPSDRRRSPSPERLRPRMSRHASLEKERLRTPSLPRHAYPSDRWADEPPEYGRQSRPRSLERQRTPSRHRGASPDMRHAHSFERDPARSASKRRTVTSPFEKRKLASRFDAETRQGPGYSTMVAAPMMAASPPSHAATAPIRFPVDAAPPPPPPPPGIKRHLTEDDFYTTSRSTRSSDRDRMPMPARHHSYHESLQQPRYPAYYEGGIPARTPSGRRRSGQATKEHVKDDLPPSVLAGLGGPGKGMERVQEWNKYVEPGPPLIEGVPQLSA
ncbi:hypothetical protein QBC45DRAFT_101967 [Copromyces sp. CBS 386.78]|nr:hypothetical protein QBC45DRAFT_101967 [Copromyces sp. CBS 386.78]